MTNVPPKGAMKQIQSIECGPFVVTSVKSHILPSEGPLRTAYEQQLKIPQFPEMIFHENVIKIHHKVGGWGISFSTLDAMKLIDAYCLPEGIKGPCPKLADCFRSLYYRRVSLKTITNVHKLPFFHLIRYNLPVLYSPFPDFLCPSKNFILCPPHPVIPVASTESWRASRQDCEFIDKEVVKPFDWTFTTEYKGTVEGDEFTSLIEETDERIDLEQLKVKEKILFYDDVCLYEDELGDNGSSMLSVKIRCMPTSFFLLMRFFLRVDDVLVRIIDTRLYHVAGTNFFLREFIFKEERIEKLQHLPPHLLTNPVEIADHLRTVKQIDEKLCFPVGS